MGLDVALRCDRDQVQRAELAQAYVARVGRQERESDVRLAVAEARDRAQPFHVQLNLWVAGRERRQGGHDEERAQSLRDAEAHDPLTVPVLRLEFVRERE